MRALFACIVLAVAYLSLYPWTFDASRTWVRMNWGRTSSAGDWVDVLSNLIFYIPLGVSGVLAWRKSRPLWRVALLISLAGLALTYGIEWAQRFLPSRHPSYRDVLLNAIGTVTGVGIGAILTRAHLPDRVTHPAWKLGPFAVLMAACWLVANGYPFFPILRRSQLMPSLENAWKLPSNPADIIDVFLGSILVCVIFRITAARAASPRKLALVAASVVSLVFVFQTVLFGHHLSLARVAAAAGGILVADRWVGGSKAGIRTLAAVLLIYLGWREFAPFQFSSLPASFSWVPFEGVFSIPQNLYLRTIFGKFFLYTGTIWALRQGGVQAAVAAAIVLILLSAGEWAQRYLPGRTAEITDVVLAICGIAVSPRR